MRVSGLAMLAEARALQRDVAGARRALDAADEVLAHRPPTWVEDAGAVRARMRISLADDRPVEAQRMALEAALRVGQVLKRRATLLHEALRAGAPAAQVARGLEQIAARSDLPIVQPAPIMPPRQRRSPPRGQRPRAVEAAERSRRLAERCEGAWTPILRLADAATHNLTAREAEVAALAGRGLTNAQIAERLVLSARTVDSHMQRIYGKLGINRRQRLADILPSTDRAPLGSQLPTTDGGARRSVGGAWRGCRRYVRQTGARPRINRGAPGAVPRGVKRVSNSLWSRIDFGRARLSLPALIAVIGFMAVSAAELAGSAWASAAQVRRAGPLWSLVGRATPARGASRAASSLASATVFGCQTTTPASCFGPAQIRAAYGVDQVATSGLGQTIVLIEAYQSPTITEDLATFDSVFGLPAPKLDIVAPDGLTPFDQSSALQTNFAGDISAEVEWAHAIAPAAQIDLVLAKSGSDADLLSAEQFAVAHDLGNVIVDPVSAAEQCTASTVLSAEHLNDVAAASQGITVLAPAGDTGAAQPSCDGSSFITGVSALAADPTVTGVGGTILNADGTTGAYHSEVAWNEPDFAAAGGGGFSTLYSPPSYQQSLGQTSRGVPDVSYNSAIIGGVLSVWSTSGQGANLVFQVGATGVAAAQYGGIVALADAVAGHGLGPINPTLYQLARDPATYASDFHDITVGNNAFPGPPAIAGFSAGPGWDAATGLGSPNAANLVPALANPNSTTVACATSAVVIAQTVSCTATVTDLHVDASTPTGRVTFTIDSPLGVFLHDPCTLAGTGPTASCTVTYIAGPGTAQRTITAKYAGDATHAAAAAQTSITVSPRATSTALSCARSTVAVGMATRCTATVSDTSPGFALPPAGTVTFTASAADEFKPAQCTLRPTHTPGHAACETTYIRASGPSGVSQTITASYPGGPIHGASQGDTMISVP
ncbi:MAG: Ig-like domain repeat protein [Solirubrobacterales bacterium]|nr:Ig-like domain repeat protein [Solirubrobacterales bacterium]